MQMYVKIVQFKIDKNFKRPVLWGLSNCGTKATDGQKLSANMMGAMYQKYSRGEDPWNSFDENEMALVYTDEGVSLISGMENYAPMLHFWIHEYPTLVDQLKN